MDQPTMRTLYSAEQVASRIDALAAELAGTAPSAVLVVIAEGARRFADALVGGMRARGASPDCRVVRARRTVSGTELGDVELLEVPGPEFLKARDVIVLDDIADEGRTLAAVLGYCREADPRSLRTAVLVSKLARRAVELKLDYVGFEIEDGWVLGFGMDLDGAYRDLDHLAVLVER